MERCYRDSNPITKSSTGISDVRKAIDKGHATEEDIIFGPKGTKTAAGDAGLINPVEEKNSVQDIRDSIKRQKEKIARGQALREADIAAYDNLLKTMAFNRSTRQYNSDRGADVAARNNEQRLAHAQAKLNQARAEIDETNAAWGARGQNIGNFAESIGYLGRELDARRDRDILLPSLGRGMTLEQIKGWVSPSRQREYALNQGFTEEEIKAAGISAYGGKIKRKRRGLTY